MSEDNCRSSVGLSEQGSDLDLLVSTVTRQRGRPLEPLAHVNVGEHHPTPHEVLNAAEYAQVAQKNARDLWLFYWAPARLQCLPYTAGYNPCAP